MKSCSKCKRELPLDSFGPSSLYKDHLRTWCKPCTNAYQSEWRRGNRDKTKMYSRKVQLRSLYGITVEDYERKLREQGGVCAICGSNDNADRRNNYFHVDHDHKTGKVRGLLCALCNKGIGCLRDDREILNKAIAYLEFHQNLW